MFRTNQPVMAQAFFDRRDELRQLHEMIDKLRAGAPSWIAIIGTRKVGKTSLVLELERTAGEDVAFVVIDAENERPLSREIYRTYALRSADAIFGDAVPASLEVAARTNADYVGVLYESERVRALSRDLQAVLRSLPDQPMEPAFVRLCLDLPERLAHELDRHVVVAFDEFQELSFLAGKRQGDPFPVMRSTWQRHQRVAYVISGSGRKMLEDMVTQRHSPFFQHFSIMYLEPFSRPDAIELLESGSPSEGRIERDLAESAVDAIGTHPFYLQLLGEEILRYEPPYDGRTLKSAIQSLLFSRTGRLSLYFLNLYDKIVGQSSQLAAVLNVLAKGPSRVTDIAENISIRTGEVSRYIERLNDAVEKIEDGRYQIGDPTFALWLQWRRPGGTVVPMSIVGDDAEKRVAEVLARLGFDLVYQSRASKGAFDLLAIRGANQMGVQVKRRDLPLRFDRDTWNRMQADARELGWVWLVAAVSRGGEVTFLDPEKARIGAEARLDRSAAIGNLPAWLRSQTAEREP